MVEKVAGRGALEELEGTWQALQAHGGAPTFFQTWEWNSTWWKRFQPGSPVLFQVSEGSRVVGLVPCYIGRSPGRPLRWIGSGTSDYLDVVALPGYRAAVTDAFGRILSGLDEAARVDLRLLEERGPLSVRYSEHCTEDIRSVRLRLPKTWEEYACTLSAKMRSNLKRGMRDLLSLPSGRVRLLQRDEVEEGMRALFRLHSARWRKRGMPGSFALPGVRDFHMEWARVASDQGWLRLYALETGATKVAVLYCVRYRNVFSYYQGGFEPAYARLSPGALLVSHAIRDAIEEGCEWFDFLRGEERYKSRWKADHVERYKRLLMPIRGWMGHMECALARRMHAVETRLRARFEGGSLFGKSE